MLLPLIGLLGACSDPLTVKCRELSVKHVEYAKTHWKKDYTVMRVEGFYSKKLDSCIHAEIAEVGADAEIRDLTGSVMRDGGNRNLLLHCDHHGADSVVLDKLKQFHGQVFNVPYSQYLDDGFGGPPRALKDTPCPIYEGAMPENIR